MATQHTWEKDPTSRRTSPRPIGWKALRQKILERDEWACQLRLPGYCIGHATEVDHIGAADDHSSDNLRAACSPCHAHRTAHQAAAAANQKRRSNQRQRPIERHPGLVSSKQLNR